MITAPREQMRPTLGTEPQPSFQHGILVVDDDTEMREKLNIWLRDQGYGVWIAAAGPEAIDLYKHNRDSISVVLIDANMAVMDGPQTLVALRQLNPQVCCCFMCGPHARYSEMSLRDMGAETVVRKPFRLTDLGQVLWKLAAPIQRQTSIQDDLWRDDGGQG